MSSARAVETLVAETLAQPHPDALVTALGDADQRQLAVKRAYRNLVERLHLPEAEVISGALAGFGAWPALEGDGSAPPLGYWL